MGGNTSRYAWLINEAVFRQGHPKGVACEPLTAAGKETLIYAQGGAMTHWA
ncbi:hypothetical protein POAR111328_00020 [Polynucleobacter arcticus]